MSQFFWAQPPCDAIYYQLCTGLNPYTIQEHTVLCSKQKQMAQQFMLCSPECRVQLKKSVSVRAKNKNGLFEGFLWPQNLQDFKLFTKLSVIIQVIIITWSYSVPTQFLILMAKSNSDRRRTLLQYGWNLSMFPAARANPYCRHVCVQKQKYTNTKTVWVCLCPSPYLRETLKYYMIIA